MLLGRYFNLDNEPNTPTKYGVRGIPTMLLFKDGELKSTSHKMACDKMKDGNTKETLWNSYYDIKDLPQVVKPAKN